MNVNKIRTKDIEWIDIHNPGREEGDFLRKKYGFHPLDISDLLSIHQAPKIDIYDDYIFLILNFPRFDKKTHRVESDQLDIFINQKTLITVHKREYKPLESLFQNCRSNIHIRQEFLGRDTGYFLYRLLHILSKTLFPVMDKISDALRDVEEGIYEEQTRDVVMELAITRRNVLSMRRFVVPQGLLLQTLINSKKDFLGEETEVYFGDILDKFDRVSAMLANFHDLVKGFNETNEALISHKTNDVMKILTVISVSLLPLNLVAGIYGMNIRGLPFSAENSAFFIIMGVMVVIILITLVLFRKKHWI